MKKRIVLAVVTTMVSQTVLPIVQATTTPVVITAQTSVIPSTESSKFLDKLSKLITEKTFRSDVAGIILSLSNFLNSGNYTATYNALPDHERKILSDRYGITSAEAFEEHIGQEGLSYKFTPADISKGKYIQFISSTLATISKRPTAKDLVMDGSGNLLGAYMNVSLPGIVFSDSISGKTDSGKTGAVIAVFVSKDEKLFASYFGPIRVLSSGKGVQVIEHFSVNPGKLSLDIGKTRGTDNSDQSKIFQKLRWLSQYDARVKISDSKGNEVLHFVIPQKPNVRNGFVRITLSTPLSSGNDYLLEIFTQDSDKVLKTVDFRY